MGAVLRFPTSKSRRRRGAASRQPIAAVVQPFPLFRNNRHVAGIAAEMRAQSCDDQAEIVLISHLELQAMRLARFGVADAEIERACSAFAVAAWRAAYHGDHTDHGAAS